MVVIDCPPTKKQWSVIGITLAVVVATVLVVVFTLDGGSSSADGSSSPAEDNLQPTYLNISLNISLSDADKAVEFVEKDIDNIDNIVINATNTSGLVPYNSSGEVQDDGMELTAEFVGGAAAGACIYYTGNADICSIVGDAVKSLFEHIAGLLTTSSKYDNCALGVRVSSVDYADGDVLRACWQNVNGNRDCDDLGYIKRSRVHIEETDTVDSLLDYVSITAFGRGKTDDVYVTALSLSAGKYNSHEDAPREIFLSATDINIMTGGYARLFGTTVFGGAQTHVRFGDASHYDGTIQYLALRWYEALLCFQRYYGLENKEYALCLRRNSLIFFMVVRGGIPRLFYHWDL